MPNGKKNNDKEIELLPEELRRPEIKKKPEEKEEVKMFVPSAEKKPEKPSFFKKFSSAAKEWQKKRMAEKAEKEAKEKGEREEKERLAILKVQQEKKAAETPPSPKISTERETERKPEPKAILPREIKKTPREATTRLVPPIRRGFGITLMPEELLAPKEDKLSKQITILVVVILFLGVIFGGVFGFLKWRQGQIVKEIKKIESNLLAVNQGIKTLESEKEQAQTLQKKLKVADKLLKMHVHWTNFFSFLESSTTPDVYFMNLMGESDGQITMSGAGKSYKAVAEQIVVFRRAEEVEKVFITSASATIDPLGQIVEVNFDASLKLKPETFFSL